jgi:type IV secretion system protein VirB9
MTARLAALAFALIAACAAPAFAQAPDPRIRIIAYSDNQIYALRGHLGYQMLVEFDPAERIENVAIGDSLGWQVTPNRAATLLFVKPVTAGAATNMTVVTTLRRYSFSLTAREATGPSDPSIVYTVRFTYPPPPAAPAAAAPPPAPPPPALSDLNLAYVVQGRSRGLPAMHVFDDGKATYFQLAETAEAPAIFVVNAEGEEELVNAQWRGRYMVVDQIAEQFVLRIGKSRARILNRGWRAPAPGPLTPPGGEQRR